MSQLTRTLGQLFRDNEGDGIVLMYSFDRVSSLFWNAFAEELMRRGYTEEQVVTELQGKGMRWMLDHDDDRVRNLATLMAADYAKDSRPLPTPTQEAR